MFKETGILPTPLEGVDPMIAQKEARLLALRARVLRYSIINFAGIPRHGQMHHLKAKEGILNASDLSGNPYYMFLPRDLPINGIGDGRTQFAFDLSDKIPDIAQKLGVNTRVELSIGYQTDEATKKAVEDLLKANGNEGLDEINTTYFFDTAGRFAKVASFPDGVDDARENLELEAWYERTVVSPMTPSDFELAGVVFNFLELRMREIAINHRRRDMEVLTP